MAYCGGGPVWAYPRGNPDLPTGKLRAQKVLLEETGVDLGVEGYHPLPRLIGGDGLVVGVVAPELLSRLPPGLGKTVPELRWRPVTEAQGAEDPFFVLLLGEGWGFLGALGAIDREQDEWILRPIVLWSKSFSGAQLHWKSW